MQLLFGLSLCELMYLLLKNPLKLKVLAEHVVLIKNYQLIKNFYGKNFVEILKELLKK
jgi:hypothetical protein